MNTSITSRLERGVPVTMLGVWAHPDDEAYLSATLMHRVIAAGGRVILITATRGEFGSNDSDHDRAGLAALREQELRSAMSVIGVSDVRFLGLADGACELADDETMTAVIADIIGQEEPDVVVTFGPDGITGHPDHQSVSRWTIGAWRRWPHTELLLATMTDEFLDRNELLHERIGLSMGPPLRSVPANDLELEIVPSADEQRRKSQMLDAHASQTTALIDLLGRGAFERWWTHEMFRLPSQDDIRWAGDAAVLIESGAG
jgi:LmbE family N-acetylglucosaminyl deacetylase